VRRLDDHQQAAGGPPGRAGDVTLQPGELDQVAVSLAPKSMLCAYAISSTAPPGSQKSSRLTHGI